ncbi:MAG TPA: septum formation family protein [Microthrixaceae bacterium]|nr:septum formation family protein [Microthrixaceae bacterium]
MRSPTAVAAGSSKRSLAFRSISLVIAFTIATSCSGSGSDKGTAEGADGSAKASTSVPEDEKPNSKTDSAKSPARETRSGVPKTGSCIEPVTTYMAGGNLMPAIVSCDMPHGGELIAVYDTPKDLDEYPAITQELKGLAQALSDCGGKAGSVGDFGKFAGDNRLKVKGSTADPKIEAWLVSSLQATLLIPSPSQWEAGERWVACAAILQHSEEALSRYSGSAKGTLLPGELESEFAWCKRQLDPNDGRSFVVVSCDEPHSHEQVASFSVGGSEDLFPGEEALSSLVNSICPDLVSTATGGRFNDSTKDFDLAWTYPVESTWQSGDRTARCYIVGVDQQSTGTLGSGTSKLAPKRS